MPGVIIKDPEILGGEPVFRGTRVPFKSLTEYLEGGDTLDQFLEQYPSVTRELAIAAIEEARPGAPRSVFGYVGLGFRLLFLITDYRLPITDN